jgi:hypothetical protein
MHIIKNPPAGPVAVRWPVSKLVVVKTGASA